MSLGKVVSTVKANANATPVVRQQEGGVLPSTRLDADINAGAIQAMQDQARLSQPSAQAGLQTSGVDQILNPFTQPEGVPMGAPTDLSSLFGMGTAGLGPITQQQVSPLASPMEAAGLDSGIAPTMASPSVSPFVQPQGSPLTMVQPQGQPITGATTLADLVSRGLGGQNPQMAANPFTQAMPQAPVQAIPQGSFGVPQASFPQAHAIAQPAAPAQAPAGMASLFAQPAQAVQAPQQPYVPAPAPAPIPVQPAYQPAAPLPAAQSLSLIHI